jgi:hypothetical protein
VGGPARCYSSGTLTHQLGAIEAYGYGVFVMQGLGVEPGSYVDTPLVHHGGDIPGFASDFYLRPAQGFGVVAFANADGAHFSASIALAMKTFDSLPAADAPLPNGPRSAPDPPVLRSMPASMTTLTPWIR